MVQFNFSNKNSFSNQVKTPSNQSGNQLTKISIEDIKYFISSNKIETFCAGFFLLTACVVWQFFSAQMAKINVLDSEVQLLSDKEDPVRKFKKIMQESDLLIKSVPLPLPDNRFITQFSLLASKFNIDVTSISPPESKESAFYRRTTSQLLCSVNSFRDALLFLHEIERSTFALKVDSFKIVEKDASDIVNQSSKLKVIIVVSTIELLDNENNKKAN